MAGPIPGASAESSTGLSPAAASAVTNVASLRMMRAQSALVSIVTLYLSIGATGGASGAARTGGRPTADGPAAGGEVEHWGPPGAKEIRGGDADRDQQEYRTDAEDFRFIHGRSWRVLMNDRVVASPRSDQPPFPQLIIHGVPN